MTLETFFEKLDLFAGAPNAIASFAICVGEGHRALPRAATVGRPYERKPIRAGGGAPTARIPLRIYWSEG